MHQEKYSLTWHTYSDHLKSMMKEMMMNDDFADVILVTEDKKQIKANLNILRACSPVFRDILKKDKNSGQIMYLRGIDYHEMESIMQFIYLGEATFYEERIDELLAVAKSLEIKELCNARPKTSDEPDEKPLPCFPVTQTEKVEEQTVVSDHKRKPATQVKEVGISINGKCECVHCHKMYFSKGALHEHIQSAHLGVKYACDQCDQQFTTKSNLAVHIQSKHEGVKWACVLCDHQFTRQSSLIAHIQSKHEGVKYACKQCDHQFTEQSKLTRHIRNKHEGVKFACDQCDFKSPQQFQLRTHIKNKHED